MNWLQEQVKSHRDDLDNVDIDFRSDPVGEIVVSDHAPDLEPSVLLQTDRKVYVDSSIPETGVADDVIRILAAQGFEFGESKYRIFQRAGKLVCLRSQSIATMKLANVREFISADIELLEETGDDKPDRTVRPPKWLVEAIFHRHEYEYIRHLIGVVTAPTLRIDGTVLQEPGYDEASRLFYQPECEFPPIPKSPSKEQAESAVTKLLDVVADFPFKSDADRSVWLAYVLTLLARPAIDGPGPMFCFSANVRGSGKSKLNDIASLIAYGKRMPRKTMPTRDEETRKVITTVAREAKPALLFDNIATTIGCESLDAALTSTTWEDRILGASESTGELPWRTVISATGNNLEFKADTARRVLLCQLQSMEEYPEDRTDFRHDDLEAYVASNRVELVTSALMLLRGFIAAGSPASRRMGSFEAWSSLIASSIEWVGLTNPMDTAQNVRDADTSGISLARLIDALEPIIGTGGLNTSEIYRLIENPFGVEANGRTGREQREFEMQIDDLRTVIYETIDRPDARKLGTLLRSYKGRISGGRSIDSRPGRSKQPIWFVKTVGVKSCGADQKTSHQKSRCDTILPPRFTTP